MDPQANPYRPPREPNPYQPPIHHLAPPPPPMQPDWVEREIAANAQFNVGMVVLGVVYPVVGPASIYRANRALALISQYGVGRHYEAAARRVRRFGIALTLLWIIGFVACVYMDRR